jgi:8-oxo-dGTP pyrophosphatase MutT (NUDIX family)
MSFDLERLQASLLPEPQSEHFVQEEGGAELPLTPAAVLFPIVLRDGSQTVLLTQRTAHLRDHAGQISFPGGRVEVEDISPSHTALRETEEEIGLLRERIEIIGYLPEYRTGTGFRVTPVVALVRPPFELQADPFEVAEVFEVPLSFLLDPANHQRHSMHYRGALRNYFAMPYGEYFIWGATAGMIRSLTERLGLLQGA